MIHPGVDLSLFQRPDVVQNLLEEHHYLTRWKLLAIRRQFRLRLRLLDLLIDRRRRLTLWEHRHMRLNILLQNGLLGLWGLLDQFAHLLVPLQSLRVQVDLVLRRLFVFSNSGLLLLNH
jgi:hypothetical protein